MEAWILNTLRRSRGPIRVRDLVRILQDERRVEGENWARRADPVLGSFSQGRQVLLRMAPTKYRPYVIELEIIDTVRRMVKANTISLQLRGHAYDPADRPLYTDAIVTIN
jgi:hypothetical protein